MRPQKLAQHVAAALLCTTLPATALAQSAGCTTTVNVNSQLTTINSAVKLSDSEVRLTSAARYQTGSFNAETALQLDLSTDFSVKFDLYFGDNDAGADGAAFVLHNDPNGVNASGYSGGHMGVFGITNGIAIEFDTFHNTTDPISDHMQVRDTAQAFNVASGGLSSVTELNNLEDGQYHPVTISWKAATDTLTTSIDDGTTKTLTYTLPDTAATFANTSKVFWGISAATGARTNEHKVKDIRIERQSGSCGITTPTPARPVPALGILGLLTLFVTLISGSAFYLSRRNLSFKNH